MLSQSKIKSIRALHQKKYREENRLFIAEGVKVCDELLRSGFFVESCYATTGWFQDKNAEGLFGNVNITEISEAELKKISTLTTPNKILCVARVPNPRVDFLNDDLILAIDSVQDPGNFGTIIRIADWFGISTIICSCDTVEAFSPKVVMSSMGSIFRINVEHTDLKLFFEKNKNEFHFHVYGTFLDGENLYSKELSHKAIILLGNESNGISHELIPFVDNKIFIPSFSKADKKTNAPQSLNVAVAAAISIAEFRRQKLFQNNQ